MSDNEINEIVLNRIDAGAFSNEDSFLIGHMLGQIIRYKEALRDIVEIVRAQGFSYAEGSDLGPRVYEVAEEALNTGKEQDDVKTSALAMYSALQRIEKQREDQ